MMMGLGTTMSIQPYGPAVPLDYVAQPFNCPPGSDFAASQEVGMCVKADYSPVYLLSQGSAKVYYDLTGQVTGVEPKVTGTCPAGTLIPCVPDMMLYAGAALALVLTLRRR